MMRQTPFFFIAIFSVTINGSLFSQDLWKHRIVPTVMTLSGLGIATVWTMEIISKNNIDMKDGFFSAVDRGTNQIMWPHWITEYSTAALLITGAYGLYIEKEWGRTLALIAAGALAYTSMNSLSWVLTDKKRIVYAIPMILSLTSAGLTIVVLF